MDVGLLSPLISVLCRSDWLFHGDSCPRLDVVHPGLACTWHCSLRLSPSSVILIDSSTESPVHVLMLSVVKLLSKRWWIPIGARLERPKFAPEGPIAEVGFSTADLGLSSIQGTLFGFRGIWIVFDTCNIYPHQAWTNANDRMTVKDYIFTKHHACGKNTQT